MKLFFRNQIQIGFIFISKIILFFHTQCKLICLYFKSLLFNYHLNFSYSIDTILDPIFLLIDRYMQTLGPVCGILQF